MEIKAEVQKADEKTANVARVLLQKKLRIPPHTAVRIVGKLDVSIEGNIMVQPSQSIKGLLSPYSITTQVLDDVPILLRNVSEHRVILQKYHILGTASPIDEIIEDHVQSANDKHSTSSKVSAELPDYLSDLEKRSVENLSESQASKVRKLLTEFHEVFAQDDMDIGLFKGITHKVNTGDAQPVSAKLRRTPLGFEKEEEAHLKSLLDKGIITPSKSEWASAAVLVRKKDGSVRYCID
jgi:hypothetical protein